MGESSTTIRPQHQPCAQWDEGCACISCYAFAAVERTLQNIANDLVNLHEGDKSPTRRATYIALASRWDLPTGDKDARLG